MIGRWLQVIFMAWRRTTLEALRHVLQTSTTGLREKLGSMANSIWHMNKATLVATATRELRISDTEATSYRAGQLQQMLK